MYAPPFRLTRGYVLIYIAAKRRPGACASSHTQLIRTVIRRYGTPRRYGISTTPVPADYRCSLQAFETYVTNVPEFNVHRKLRRSWQDGSDTSSSIYQMSGQMFVKRSKFTSLREQTVAYPLHPWVETASKTSSYFPNPDRTRFLEPSNGVLVNISECDPPYIRTGDFVCISFFSEFIIGNNNWSTTFTPYEVIRVATVSPDLVGDGKGGDFEPDQPREGVIAGQRFLMRKRFVYITYFIANTIDSG